MTTASSGKPAYHRSLAGPDALDDDSVYRVVAFARKKRRYLVPVLKGTVILGFWLLAAALAAGVAWIVVHDVPPDELSSSIHSWLGR